MKKKDLSIQSKKLFEQAKKKIPGGVNSPVRAFKGVGGTPRFIEKAKGAYLYDVDGNKMIDYVGSWGPMILGHANPKVVKSIRETASKGSSFGAPNQLEIKLAELIQKFFPSIEKIRMTNSGTEAVMGAIRVARAYTKRNFILKFEGCYHGHADYLLVEAGSGALTFGVPNSAGVPLASAQQTFTTPYNQLEEIEKLFRKHPKEIAAIIVEPVVGNSGLILPKPGFLEGLRQIADRYQSLLIFDEVMTGFRVSLGGAQQLYKVQPDLTTLGKIIGGGLPVGAFGGKAAIMDLLAPEGPVYQAGTLSGNPLAMAAGIETITQLTEKGIFKKLEKTTSLLAKGIQKVAEESGVSVQVPFIGAMIGLFFSEKPVFSLKDAVESNTERFKKFFHGMLENGIYLPPSPFESWFVSTTHQEKEVARTIRVAKELFQAL